MSGTACDRRSARSRERGVATVHAVWVAVALVVLTVLILQITALVRVRHEAQAAADLAALAASRAVSLGDDGCAAARTIAAANAVELTACRLDLEVATVTTAAARRPWWGGAWRVEATSRAAPAWYER